MGLINTIFGNSSEMNIEKLQEEYAPLLCADERIEKAYRLIRDKWVFTNKRVILQDVQGVTGRKREYLTIPYGSVVRFSVETAGTLDMDSDIKIWIKGSDRPLEQKLGKDVNPLELQRVLADHVL